MRNPLVALLTRGVTACARRCLMPALLVLAATVGAPPVLAQGRAPGNASGSLLAFPGASAYRTPDVDGNGRFDALEVDVTVDVLVAGNYVVLARLQGSKGQLVANRPRFESMLFTRASFSGGTGQRTITLRFSGEQIRRSGIDGPYKLALYANTDAAAAGAGSLVTPAFRWADFGEVKARLRSLSPAPVDEDGSGKFEALRVTFEVDSVSAGPFQVGASVLGGGTGLASKSRVMMLTPGLQTVTLDLPATGIARSGIDGPYEVTVNLSETNGTNVDSAQTVLTGLLASQFEAVVNVSASLTEQLIDSNANGLFDLLRVGAEVRVRAPRDAVVHATLVGANGSSVAVDTVAALQTAAGQRVNFDFSGPSIRRMQMDSQYQLDLSFRSPTTFEEFDAVRIPLRGVYVYTRFDPAEAPRAIALTGTRTDRGIDTNANGLFERLQVDLGVELAAGGVYDWSARLVDRNGLEIGFAANRGSLAAGTTSIRLEFDGRLIGANGFDGPYFIRSLLIAGTGGANLVSTFAGESSAWQARQFEGFVVRLPADLNGDGVVNTADVDAFNRAFGSSVGEPAYNRFADYDRDGRITLNDLRIFRGYYR